MTKETHPRSFAPYPFPEHPEIEAVELTNFRHFVEEVSKFSHVHGVAWRGQASSSWRITSSAFRAEQRRMLSYDYVIKMGENSRHIPVVAQAVEDRLEIASRPIQNAIETDPHLRLLFREEILSKEISENRERYNELLSVGQHFGLCTPLIDVSYSPYVALFFAARDALLAAKSSNVIRPNGRIAVWKIPCNKWRFPVERVVVQGKDAKEIAQQDQWSKVLNGQVVSVPALKIRVENVFPHSYRNERLVAQQGSFVRVTPDLPLDHVLSVLYDEQGNTSFDAELKLYTLPAEEALSYLLDLRQMNVRQQTLFPDIVGQMEDLNLSLDHYDYQGLGDRPSRGSMFDYYGDRL